MVATTEFLSCILRASISLLFLMRSASCSAFNLDNLACSCLALLFARFRRFLRSTLRSSFSSATSIISSSLSISPLLLSLCSSDKTSVSFTLSAALSPYSISSSAYSSARVYPISLTFLSIYSTKASYCLLNVPKRVLGKRCVPSTILEFKYPFSSMSCKVYSLTPVMLESSAIERYFKAPEFDLFSILITFPLSVN